MKTLLLIEPEPIADGGWFVRSALHLSGAPWASNVRITVRPGADSEYGHVAHTFVSSSVETALTIDVGRVDARARTRVLIEFLVRPDVEPGAVAEVAEVVVEGDVPSEDGLPQRRTVVLSVRLDADRGAFADADVRTEAPRAASPRADGRRQARSARRNRS